MTAKELEEFLRAGVETQRIEFKGRCAWHVGIFAKDILALSNMMDGGFIIVGVEETGGNDFYRRGITEEEEESFKIDEMRDQMENFADPHVDFRVEFLRCKEGKRYAVIVVSEFEEIPVICRKDSGDLKKGRVYYRGKARRIESSPVSNSYDMREIIERAAIKRVRRMQELGLWVGPSTGTTAERSTEEKKKVPLKGHVKESVKVSAELDKELEGL